MKKNPDQNQAVAFVCAATCITHQDLPDAVVQAEAVRYLEEQLRGPAVLRTRPGRHQDAAGGQEDGHYQHGENGSLGGHNQYFGYPRQVTVAT